VIQAVYYRLRLHGLALRLLLLLQQLIHANRHGGHKQIKPWLKHRIHILPKPHRFLQRRQLRLQFSILCIKPVDLIIIPA
jgi:hypothetical protein